MSDLEKIAPVLAYQTSNVRGMRHVYDLLRFDINEVLAQEERIRNDIPGLVEGIVALSEAVETGKIPSAEIPCVSQNFIRKELAGSHPRSDGHRWKNMDDLIAHAETYLRQHGVDPAQDPLLQVLDAREILDITESYRQKYGLIAWNRVDYAVVTVAGCVGALLDIFLVKLPGNLRFLSTLPRSYALTTWIDKNFRRIQTDYLAPIAALASAAQHTPRPIDADDTEPSASKAPLPPDVLLAFIFGVLDIVRYTGTYVDEHGNIVQSQRLSEADQRQQTITLVRLLLRLFSTVFASSGMPPPFGSLLQEKDVVWDNVAEYLHEHGYQPQQLLLMGIVPATIELLVKGYWLLVHFDDQAQLERTTVKLTSLLLFSHTVTASGHFLKTGLIFQLNPFLLNWDRLLRCSTLLISWINEGI